VRPRREPLDPYATLGLAPGASRAEVRRAYRRRAKAIHPDIAGADATEEMARLNDAREQLEARAPRRGRSGDPSPADASADMPPPAPRERPSWAAAHEPAWTDHWSAWNDLRRRD
jgi:molecular chaperone DnaJ